MKDQRITVRLSAELQAEITDACKITGLDEPTIIRECLKAFVDEVKASGEIRLPLAIVPKSSKKHLPFLSTATSDSPRDIMLNDSPTTAVPERGARKGNPTTQK